MGNVGKYTIHGWYGNYIPKCSMRLVYLVYLPYMNGLNILWQINVVGENTAGPNSEPYGSLLNLVVL